jgi:microcystin-dependent protein
MADLIVKPSYQLGPRDILTVDKINLMATPVVELALEDPVNDQNFFRNGNFYSSFWVTPAGVSCPAGAWTTNANYFLCKPTGGAVNFLRSNQVPDIYSLFSAEIQGAVNVADVQFGQQINGDLSATLRRKVTFSGYIYNGSGLTVSPTLKIYTADAFNNFNTVTLQTTVNLQTGANATWTYVTATLDLSIVTNVANGLFITVDLPAGTLNDPSKFILFSRLKVQIGEIATEFVDDTSLFVESPSVDSTMLQDGCIARPSLFLPNVVPTGAYQAKSIANGDIKDGAIDGRTMAAGASLANLGFTPINKAGDTAIGPGPLAFVNDDVIGAGTVAAAATVIGSSSANAANDGYMPAISFTRPTKTGRAIGLDINGRFKTVSDTGAIGFLLDSVFQVQTTDVKDKAITLAKLADEVVNMIIPPGIVKMFAGSGPPTGWLVCDGRAVSRVTYAQLFAAIGTFWGTGDNQNTFNLPDFRGRSPIGYVNTPAPGITARAFGSRGGEESHVISKAEMAAHDHNPVNDPQHVHGLNQSPHHHGYNMVGGSGSIAAGTGFTLIGQNTTDVAISLSMNAAATGISLPAEGGNVAHNNMQPYGVLYFIVKT